jgi:hypothetical protein
MCPNVWASTESAFGELVSSFGQYLHEWFDILSVLLWTVVDLHSVGAHVMATHACTHQCEDIVMLFVKNVRRLVGNDRALE